MTALWPKRRIISAPTGARKMYGGFLTKLYLERKRVQSLLRKSLQKIRSCSREACDSCCKCFCNSGHQVSDILSMRWSMYPHTLSIKRLPRWTQPALTFKYSVTCLRRDHAVFANTYSWQRQRQNHNASHVRTRAHMSNTNATPTICGYASAATNSSSSTALIGVIPPKPR